MTHAVALNNDGMYIISIEERNLLQQAIAHANYRKLLSRSACGRCFHRTANLTINYLAESNLSFRN